MRASVSRPGQHRLVRILFAVFLGWWISSPQPLNPTRAIGLWDWPRIGLASWYSEQDPGVTSLTASGEQFLETGLTAAMWELPFDACVQVTNLRTLDRVVVRVNDRGPHRRLMLQGRVIDLSLAAFSRLADPQEGLIPVRVELTPGGCPS